jgi:hypothetical protein
LSRRRFTPVVELGCRQLTYPCCAPLRGVILSAPKRRETRSPNATYHNQRDGTRPYGDSITKRDYNNQRDSVRLWEASSPSTSRHNQRDGARLVGAETMTPLRGAPRGRRVAGLGEFDDRCEPFPRQISIRCAPVVALSPMPYRPRASRRRRGSSVSEPKRQSSEPVRLPHRGTIIRKRSRRSIIRSFDRSVDRSVGRSSVRSSDRSVVEIVCDRSRSRWGRRTGPVSRRRPKTPTNLRDGGTLAIDSA